MATNNKFQYSNILSWMNNMSQIRKLSSIITNLTSVLNNLTDFSKRHGDQDFFDWIKLVNINLEYSSAQYLVIIAV